MSESILYLVWHIPEGFATFLIACATALAGSFAIIAVAIAWLSVQRQIRSAENIEKARHETEIATVEAGFTAELMIYSRGIIAATSVWN
jgi:hypothetical protein